MASGIMTKVLKKIDGHFPVERSISYIIFLLILCSGCLSESLANSRIEVKNRAEWEIATTALMHTPEEELFLGVLHPDAALFERPFDPEQAANEHRNFIHILEDRYHVRVITVINTLLSGTIDSKGKMLPGPDLDRLREFSKEFFTIDSSELQEGAAEAQKIYRDKIFQDLPPRTLVRIILTQPTIRLHPTRQNTGLSASYEVDPVMNLYFMRDQMIITGRGAVIGRMNSEQREPETKIVEFVLEKLRIKPIYKVTDPGRLEGGDFLPAGDTVFIGQGLRTNAEAIRQLLEAKVFDAKRVVVVKDLWKNQDQMHLDTYFNIVDANLAVLSEDRMVPSTKSKFLTADVYILKEGHYRIQHSDVDFVNFLKKEIGFHLITVAVSDQLAYGINFLTVSPRTILGINGVSSAYKKQLEEAGVNATWIDFRNMAGGYGAAHCTTQVLERRPLTGK